MYSFVHKIMKLIAVAAVAWTEADALTGIKMAIVLAV
jgi:hypothetical protein